MGFEWTALSHDGQQVTLTHADSCSHGWCAQVAFTVGLVLVPDACGPVDHTLVDHDLWCIPAKQPHPLTTEVDREDGTFLHEATRNRKMQEVA